LWAWGGLSTSASAGFWARLVRRVMRRPFVWGGAVALLLLAAATPLLGMETGASGVSTFPSDLPSRQGYEALRESFPDQAFNPARIVVHDPGGVESQRTKAGVNALETALMRDERFGRTRTIPTDDELLRLEVSVGADSLSPEAVEAVRDLRSKIIPAAFAGTDDAVEVLVTGDTALNIDYFDVMREWLPIVLAFVLGLSFLILLVVFHSLAAPVVAIVLNLLSVGATYGLLVLVFQHGVGAGLLGFRQIETTEAWVPLFLFSVLFGLSMDYHMFLLTRIRERWSHTGDTREAVAWAVGSTGRLITGAALIIVAVFAGFAVGDLVMFQQMGFGIAVALLIDATLVRGVLLPAAMALLGEHNWYLPRWLQWLPEVQLEEE
jgi:RND superfamily putative drug exporter